LIEKREVPSGISPCPAYADLLAQVGRPDLQNLHSPHSGVYSGITWIAGFDAGHAGADFLDDAAALVTEDHREHAFGIGAGQRESVGVAHAGGDDANEHFACLRPLKIDLLDAQGFACFPGDRSTGFHFLLPRNGDFCYRNASPRRPLCPTQSCPTIELSPKQYVCQCCVE
jgi:hypothetical protein